MVATRSKTKPIPEHLRERFYAMAWEVAVDGCYTDNYGYRRPLTKFPYTSRRHALVVLWLTACALRISELRQLRVDDICTAGYSAYIRRSKGGLSGNLILSRRLIELTFTWREENTRVLTSPFLIPTRTGQPLSGSTKKDNANRDALKPFAIALGMAKLTTHCFRDTACQMALVQGAEMKVVQTLMGHKSLGTTEIYAAKQQARSFQLALPGECH